MKELARFNGKVIKLNAPPQASDVRLTEVGTDKTVETAAVSTTLIAAGLSTGDDFVVIIQESNGRTSGIIRQVDTDKETDFDI